MWSSKNINNLSNNQIKSFTLNFGPQHPASHGVLRLILQLNGELIEKSDCHIGFLHRGTEKLIENRNYLQSLPYLDRLDYVSMMSQEHSYVLAVESLIECEHFSSPYSQIRVIFDELTRLLNHFLGIATHSLDIGSMSPAFWAFEERERIMEFYERVSGARMHAAFYRPNSLDWSGINYQLFLDIIYFCRDSFKSITEIFVLLSTNKIWKSRLVNIGILSSNDCLKYGASGVMLRSSGLKKDLRFLKSHCYSFYWYIKFNSYVGKNGDCYDRFLIRIREMFESINIINQTINNIILSFNSENSNFNDSTIFSLYNFIFLNNLNMNIKLNKYNNMEKLIEHFKLYSNGMNVNNGFIYKSIEAPKGEFGVSIVSDGSSNPYRCKFKSSAYNHLSILPKLIQGHMFADMITLLGSLDIVFGEIDR